MMTMSKTLITSRDPKGLQIATLFDAALNKAPLDSERAQRLIERGGEFQDGILELMAKLSAPEPIAKWTEKDGVIKLTVTSDGKTGQEWISHFEANGVRLSKWAKGVLLSPDFKPTNGVTTKIEVLKGSLFTDNDRITSKIRVEADKRKFSKPNAEVACLIRDMFTDAEMEAMGLYWIVVFHEPIKDSDGFPDLLRAGRPGDGLWLHADDGEPDGYWYQDSGFAFASGK